MKKEMATNVVWGVAMIGLALAVKFAEKQGHIGHDAALRVLAMNGLWLAYYGNQMPKTLVPGRCARRARRVAGWALTISGLVYAALFLFAPISVAVPVGTGAIVTGIAVTLGYCLTMRSRTKAASY